MDFVPTYFRFPATARSIRSIKRQLLNVTIMPLILDRFKMSLAFVVKSRSRPYLCINLGNLMTTESQIFQVLFSQSHYVQEADGDWIYFSFYLSSTTNSYNDQRMFFYEQNKDRFQQVSEVPAVFSSQLTYLNNVAYYTAAATGDYFALYRVGQNVLTPLCETQETQWYQFYATQFITQPVRNIDNTLVVFAPPSSKKFFTNQNAWYFNTPSTSGNQDATFGLSTVYLAADPRSTLDFYLVTTPNDLLLTLADVISGQRYAISVNNILALISQVANEKVISNFTAAGFDSATAIETTISSVSQVTTDLITWLASIAQAYGFDFNDTQPFLPSSYPTVVATATMSKITLLTPEAQVKGYMNSMSCDYSDTYKQYELDRRCTPNLYNYPLLKSLFRRRQLFNENSALIRTGNNNVLTYLQPEQIRNYIRMEIYPFDLTKESEFVKLRVQGIDELTVDVTQFTSNWIIFTVQDGSPVSQPLPELILGVADTSQCLLHQNEQAISITPIPLADWDQVFVQSKTQPVVMNFTGQRTAKSLMEVQLMPQYTPPSNVRTAISYSLTKIRINSLANGAFPPNNFIFSSVTILADNDAQTIEGALFDFRNLTVPNDFPTQIYARYASLVTNNIALQDPASFDITTYLLSNMAIWRESVIPNQFTRMTDFVSAADLISFRSDSEVTYVPIAPSYTRYIVLIDLPSTIWKANTLVPIDVAFTSPIFPNQQLYHYPTTTYERRRDFGEVSACFDEVICAQLFYYWNIKMTPALLTGLFSFDKSAASGDVFAYSSLNPVTIFNSIPSFGISIYKQGTVYTNSGTVQTCSVFIDNISYGFVCGTFIDRAQDFSYPPYLSSQRQQIANSFSVNAKLTLQVGAENLFFRSSAFTPQSNFINDIFSPTFSGTVKGPLINSAGVAEAAAWLTSVGAPVNEGSRWSFLVPAGNAEGDSLRVQLLRQLKVATGSSTSPFTTDTNVNDLFQFETIGFTDNLYFEQIVSLRVSPTLTQNYYRCSFLNQGFSTALSSSDIFLKITKTAAYADTIPQTYLFQIEKEFPLNSLVYYPQLFPLYTSSPLITPNRLTQITTNNLLPLLTQVNFTYDTQIVLSINEATTYALVENTGTYYVESWITNSATTTVHRTGPVVGLFDEALTPLSIDVTNMVIPPFHTHFRVYITCDASTIYNFEPLGPGGIVLDVKLTQKDNIIPAPGPLYAGRKFGSYSQLAFSYRSVVTQWPFTLKVKRKIADSSFIVKYAITDQAQQNPNPLFPQTYLLVKQDLLAVWDYSETDYYFDIPLPAEATTQIGLRMLITLEVDQPPCSIDQEIYYTTIAVTIDPKNTIYSFNSKPLYITLPLTDEEMSFWGEVFLQNPKVVQFYIELELALIGGKRDYIWPQFSEFCAIAMKEGDHSSVSTMLVLTDNAENYGYQSSYYSVLYSQIDGNQRFFWQKFLQRPTALFLTTLAPIKLLDFDIWDYKLKRTLCLFFR
jgi:hypothetical protein